MVVFDLFPLLVVGLMFYQTEAKVVTQFLCGQK